MHLVTNTNKVMMYVTVRQQSLLYVKDEIAAKEKKFRVLQKSLDIKENRSMKAYNAHDRYHYDQKVSCVSSS